MGASPSAQDEKKCHRNDQNNGAIAPARIGRLRQCTRQRRIKHVLAAERKRFDDAADLEEQLLGRPPSAPVALRVWRDRRIVELVLTRDARERP